MFESNDAKLREVQERKEKIKVAIDHSQARINRRLKWYQHIRTQLALVIMAVVFVACTFVQLMNIQIAKSSTMDALYESLENTAVITADDVNTNINKMVLSVQSIADNVLFTDPNVSLDVKFDMLAAKKEELGFLAYYNWILGAPEFSSIDLENDSAYQSILNGNSVISSPFVNADNQLVVRIYVPVYNTYAAVEGWNYEKQLTGAIVVDFDAIVLTNLISNIKVGNNGTAYILDSDGVIIASTELFNDVLNQVNHQSDNSVDESIRKAEAAMIVGGKGSADYKNKGVEGVLAYAPIKDYGWSIAIDVKTNDFTATLHSGVFKVTIAFIVLVMIAGLIALFVAHSLAKPISNLTNVAKGLAMGDFSGIVDVKNNNELGILGDAMILTLQNIKSITKDIARVTGAMEQKDLVVYTESMYVGEFAAIEESLNSLRDTFSVALREIAQVSSEVNSGADQVSVGAQALAEGSTEQATSIEELGVTIGDLYDQIRENAENATSAAETTDNAGKEVEKSNAYMSDLMGAMDDIMNKSGEISKIIKTIEDIAFQTNILALNAAVEAARAGAYGKGFSVVADEVRNLANKSSEAAKETTELIEQTTEAIANGSGIAVKTAMSLQQVVEATNNAVKLVDSINQASTKQAQALASVTSGIDDISNVVSQNSASAEESAAASQQLNSQVVVLNGLIEQYNLMDVE